MSKHEGSALLAGVDPQAWMGGVVAELADARFAGRRVGTAGGRAAADWLAALLGQLGASVSTDDFAAAAGVRDVYATPQLSWGDTSGSTTLTFRRDFCEHLASADQPSVHRGRLVRASDPNSIAAAWVLDDTYAPDRSAAFAAAGAAGVLVPRGTDEAGWMPKMMGAQAVAPLPVIAVRRELHERMASAADSGLVWASGSAPVRTVDAVGTNVHGVFRPGQPTLLLTAHFDGVGDDPDGIRFPAAADNASGVAVVLAAAHELHRALPPAFGLAVALVDGEEIGAYGSAHHAPQVQPATWVINVDGAAALREAAAVEAGGPAHALLAALDQAGRVERVPLRPGAMPSDNRRYVAVGLPAVGIGMGIPGYQTPAETADRVEPSTLDAARRLVVATGIALASQLRAG